MQVERQTFGTLTGDLQELKQWLQHWRVTHVALESTVIYFALSSALIGRVQVPRGARMRSAVSKSGDNTSLAGESGRYGKA